tara:strand:+ start:212 stop:685 length:474 start_codon:yes stop_codon:yes gene_type:complete
MPGSNPYELRLQLFQEAKSICWEEYSRNVSEFERIRDNNYALEKKYDADLSRYESLKEQGKLGSLEYPVYPSLKELPEYPKYPTMEELKEKATFIRNFCDDKGENSDGIAYRKLKNEDKEYVEFQNGKVMETFDSFKRNETNNVIFSDKVRVGGART